MDGPWHGPIRAAHPDTSPGKGKGRQDVGERDLAGEMETVRFYCGSAAVRGGGPGQLLI